MKKMRGHLEAAGIPFVDEQGRRLDFHALRMTCDTVLAIAGVSDAARMKWMRHKTPRLTTETYLDGEKVPVMQALATLSAFGSGANGKEHTGKNTGISGKSSLAVSIPVTIENGLSPSQAIESKGESRDLAAFVNVGQKESTGGEGGIRTPGTV